MSEDLVERVKRNLRNAKVKQAGWRTLAKEAYAFYSGEQWNEEDMAILEEQGRPPVVFNRIARTINAIGGLEVQNRQEVRYIPREISDSAVNDPLSDAAAWVRDNCDAGDEESEAFIDALICGMGWTITRLDYTLDPDGMIVIERDDPLSFLWDPSAKKRNLDDSKWRAHIKLYSREDMAEMWPRWTPSAKECQSWLEDMDEEEAVDVTPPRYRNDQSDRMKADRRDIEVVCYQYWELETFYRAVGPEGGVVELTEEKMRAAKEANLPIIDAVKQWRRKYKVAYLAGDQLLEERDLEGNIGFTINAITGLRDRNNNTWFGLVELMKDPARWSNKWLSQIMYILSTNSKGGLLAEEDAFADPRRAEDEWSDPAAITWVTPGAIAAGKIQQKDPAPMPVGLEALLRYAVETVDNVAGTNAELLGQAQGNQPGVLETTRKQAGVTMLGLFFDSLRRYRKEQGRVLARLIIDYVADGRLIRITGPQGEQAIPLLRGPLASKYDIIVDDAPSSPNQKEKTFTILATLLPQLMQAGVPMPPDLLDYSPLPTSLVAKWKEYIQQQGEAAQGQPDPNQQIAELMAQQEQLKLETVRAKAEMEAQKSAMQLEVKRREMELDQRKAELEMRNKEYELNLERMRNEMKLVIEQQKFQQRMMVPQ